MERLKDLARAQRRTMTDLISEFIAEGLASRAAGAEVPPRLVLPVFRMGRPKINLADREALEAAME